MRIRASLSLLSIVAVTAAASGCATHVSRIEMHHSSPNNILCDKVVELGDRAAAEFGMRDARLPDDRPRELSDGEVLLARYSARGPVRAIPGSLHSVYLSAYANRDCSEARFAIIDYDSGTATDYVEALRARLVELIRQEVPTVDIESREFTTHTVPP